MVKLTENLSEINPSPFIAPGVTDTSEAELIQKTGAGIKAAWDGYTDYQLEGTETDDVSSMFPEEGPPNIADINLHQITTARKQGRITADMAKVMAQTAVRRASTMQPGRSGEFRQQAAEFFGDFSPGQGVLADTPYEVAEAKQRAADSKALDTSLTEEAGLTYFEKQKFYAGDPDILRKTQQRYEQFSRNENAKRNAEFVKNNKEMSKDAQDMAVKVGAATTYMQFDNQYIASLNAAGINIQDIMDLDELSPDQKGDAKAILLQEMGRAGNDLRSQNPLVAPQDFTSSWSSMDTKAEQLLAILNKDETVKAHYKNANDIETAMITQQLMKKPGAASLIMTSRLGMNPSNVPGLLPRIYGIQGEIDEVIAAINPTKGQGIPSATMYNDPTGKTNVDAVNFINASYDAWSKNTKDSVAPAVKKDLTIQMGNAAQDSDIQPIKAVRNLLKISARPDFLEFLKQNEEARYLQVQYPDLLANTFKRTVSKIRDDLSVGMEDVVGIIRMELDSDTGTIGFVPAEGLIPSVYNRAATVAQQYNKNYSSLFNDSITSFAHLQGNKNYTEARATLIRAGLINEIPLALLSREQQAQFLMEQGEGSLSNALQQVDDALKASKAPMEKAIDRTLGYLYKTFIEPIGKKEVPKKTETLTNFKSPETNIGSITTSLTEKGYSKEAIAGILGNIDVETGGSFSPLQLQKGGGNGYGLFQFDFMRPYYEKFLGDREDSIELQIEFMDDIIKGDKQDIIGKGNAAKLRKALEGDDPEEIAIKFMEIFERPGIPHKDRRTASTRKYYTSESTATKKDNVVDKLSPGTYVINGELVEVE